MTYTVQRNGYATGLRASEVVALKVADIDSERMTLGVEQGKGHKDRYAMLAPVLLERQRVWWRVARAQGKMPDGGWGSGAKTLGMRGASSMGSNSRQSHTSAMHVTAFMAGKIKANAMRFMG